MVRELEAARTIGADLERSSLDADVARIAAETAEAVCLAAREAVATCEQSEADGNAASRSPTIPSEDPPPPDEGERPAAELGGAALGGAGTPRIFRLLRGDRAAMADVVAEMGSDDPEDGRRWQLALTALVEAILADSIEASALEFPAEHPFWGLVTRTQGREVAGALASLGYRFDGLGGWVDDRIPTQRDLSLALAYAGLDPMRPFPSEGEMGDLWREVTVAADEHLAGAAADLILGELVTMLGKRADPLTELWNRWGRLRALLLDER